MVHPVVQSKNFGQGFFRSWKTRKVLEFCGIVQD